MTYHFQFMPVLLRWRVLVDGFWITLLLTACGVAGGFALGVVGAVARSSRIAILRWLVRGYVECFRNTPMLVQLFFVFFGLPSFGVHLSPVQAAVATLVLNNAAYTIEIVRAGLLVTHRSQIEAAESLGLSRLQSLVHVVIPPALERVYPALVSQFVLLMLSTSITSAIGVQELTGATGLVESDTFRSIEAYLIAALFYLALNYGQRIAFSGLGLLLFPRRRRRFAVLRAR